MVALSEMAAAAPTSATTAVQVWTLVVAALAVVATIVGAILLRRTGRGTVAAAEEAAEASKQSAAASERSAAVAVASLEEAMAASASAPAEEFFLAHLVERRTELRERLDAMWSINYQLAAIMLVARRKDWETDLTDQSPANLELPQLSVEPSITSSLPMALSSFLASISALTARFEAVKSTATVDECWRLLRSVEVDARKGREILDQTIGGVQGSEARVVGEIREMRNSMGRWRRERHQAFLAQLGLESAGAADEPSEATE